MVKKDDARRFLNDVAPEQCFWVNNGPILKNIEELANTLPQIADESYSHHVNKDKNDFGTWIKEVIGDSRLADELFSSRSKDSAIKKIRSRVNALKKKAS